MSEPLPAYTTTRGRSSKTERLHTRPPADLSALPAKAHKLGLRMLQLAKEPGEYHFTLIVDRDGRWQLRPPAKVEELGL